MPQFSYQCRSCGVTRAISPAQLEAARRGLEQFADGDAELAELFVSGDHAIAAAFEFCPACRALEQIADVERDSAPDDSPRTSRPYQDEHPDSDFYRE